MIKLLIGLGLVLVPFYELLLRMFPCVTTLSPDTRLTKELMTCVLCLGIALLALFKGQLKEFKNKYLLWFVFLLLASINFIPRVPAFINNVDSTSFWIWKPILQSLIVLLFCITVSSLEVAKCDIKNLFKIISVSGALMAGYCILQALGFDGLFITKSVSIIGSVEVPNIGGLLGQPTLVAPFIALTIPFSLALKKFGIIPIILCIIAVILTGSQIAIGAMIISLLIYLCLYFRKIPLYILSVLLILCLGYYVYSTKQVGDNGRFKVWKQVISDVKEGPLENQEVDSSLFGAGIGSFPYLFSPKYNSHWKQPHNAYLRTLYFGGFIGLILFLLSIWYVVKNTLYEALHQVEEKRTVIIATLCSLICILLCAVGSFVLQLGVYWYYGAIIVGLLHNQQFIKGEYHV